MSIYSFRGSMPDYHVPNVYARLIALFLCGGWRPLRQRSSQLKRLKCM